MDSSQIESLGGGNADVSNAPTGDSADRWVAIPLPINGAAATLGKVKSNAVAAVGVALVDLPVAIEPHSLF